TAVKLARSRGYPADTTLEYVIPAVAKALTPEQFSAGLTLAVKLARSGISPADTLRYAIPAVPKASPTTEAFQGNLQAVEPRVESHHPRAILAHIIPAAARTLTPQQFSAGLTLVVKLARSRGYPNEALLEYAIPAVAKASPTAEAFQSNLQALERFV